jgi:hypothetical protein
MGSNSVVLPYLIEALDRPKKDAEGSSFDMVEPQGRCSALSHIELLRITHYWICTLSSNFQFVVKPIKGLIVLLNLKARLFLSGPKAILASILHIFSQQRCKSPYFYHHRVPDSN